LYEFLILWGARTEEILIFDGWANLGETIRD